MSTENDVARSLRSWLRESRHEDANRVLDAVFDQVPATPQRRAGWLARRLPPMTNTKRIVLVAAAALAIAVVGIQLFKGSNVGNPVTSTTPEPTSMPTARPLPASGELPAGTYLMPAQHGPPFIFTVLAGWEVTGDGLIVKNTGQKAIVDITTGLMLAAWKVDHVYTDACRHQSGDIVPVGPSVDDLAVALHQQEGRGADQPREVVLGGHRGLKVVLPSRAFISLCGGFVHTWPDVGGDEDGGFPAGMGQTDVVYIVDVEGERAVITTSSWTGSEREQRELEEVIRSIEFVAVP